MRLASDDPIEVHPLLGGLPLADSTWATAQMRHVVLHEDEVLLTAGEAPDRVLLLIDAAVSLQSGGQGGSIELTVMGCGQCPGAIALVTGAPSAVTLVAVHQGRALSLPVPGEGQPTLRARLMELAGREAALLVGAAQRFAFATARQRLAAHLLDMWIATEARLLPIHHERLATTLGLRRATVTVALQELEESHAVRARRGTVEIVDAQTLEEATFQGG